MENSVDNSNISIYAENLTKEYRLGMIGSTTLRADVQSMIARMRGKEDPNSKLGADNVREGYINAVSDVSFAINKGDRIGIIGHNGAGKSTLLKLICRITRPTKGMIAYNGRVTSMLEVGTGFHPELTGRENIYLNGAILGMTKNEIDERFDEIVEFSEVGKFIDTPVKRYSSGMFVRLGFSVSAHLNADIVIMDEVLAVGDVLFQEKCIGKMLEIAEEKSRTILYVSHNMFTVQSLCNRCFVMNAGKLVYDGDFIQAEQIYRSGLASASGKSYSEQSNRPAYLRGSGEALFMDTRYSDEEGHVVTGEFKVLLRWRFIRDLSSVNLRVAIFNRGNNHAVASTLLTDLEGGKAGEEREQTVCIDVSNLQNGYYRTVYELFEVGKYKNYHRIDGVKGLSFSIASKGNDEFVHWESEKWGSIRL